MGSPPPEEGAKTETKKKTSGKNNNKTTKNRHNKIAERSEIKWKQFKEIINIKIIKLNYKIIFLIKNI